MKKHGALPTDLLQYKEQFRRYADFKHFPVEGLRNISHFMGITPVTGVNIINNVLRITGKQIPVNAPVVRVIAKRLMVRELNMYFRRIRNYDVMYSFDNLMEFSDEEIDKLCFNRGIDIDNQDRKGKIDDLKLWLSISNQRNVPHSLLLYARIQEFTNDQFRVDDEENEDKILRRVSYKWFCFDIFLLNFRTFQTHTIWKR